MDNIFYSQPSIPNMAFGLKLHLHTQISSIPFTKLVRSPQTPLFQLQPIQTSSFSPLQLKTRTNPRGFNASYLGNLNINGGGGGGGGGVEDMRKDGGGGGGGGGGGAGDVVKLFVRGVEFLLDPERAIVRTVGMPGKLVQLCAQAMWQLHLAMMEICNVVMMCLCAGVVLVSVVVAFLVFQFV